jgi:hypothetical protein
MQASRLSGHVLDARSEPFGGNRPADCWVRSNARGEVGGAGMRGLPCAPAPERRHLAHGSRFSLVYGCWRKFPGVPFRTTSYHISRFQNRTSNARRAICKSRRLQAIGEKARVFQRFKSVVVLLAPKVRLSDEALFTMARVRASEIPRAGGSEVLRCRRKREQTSDHMFRGPEFSGFATTFLGAV